MLGLRRGFAVATRSISQSALKKGGTGARVVTNATKQKCINAAVLAPKAEFSTTSVQRDDSYGASMYKNFCLSFTEEDQMLRESVSKFSREMIQPLVQKMDKESKLDDSVKNALFEQGLMGIDIPEKYGGSGLSFISSLVCIEELSKVDPAVGVIVDVQNTLVNTIIQKFGTEEQKQKYLPRLATDTVGSFCLSESGSGSDAFALKTTATEDGDHYILNGTKAWITNSQEAGIFLVMANADPSKGYKGITCFVVEKGNPGLTIGKKEDKLGIRASSTCEVILQDCRVSKNDIMGELGKGYKIAISTLNEGRIGIASQMVGLAQGVFDYTLPYLNQRVQFGKPISEFQGMQFQYAQAAIEIQAARLLVYEAARMKMAGVPFVKEASMAKVYASQVASKVSAQCIEWLGGVGFTKEFAAEKFYRDCIVGKIYEGTTNINLQTIAKHIRDQYSK